MELINKFVINGGSVGPIVNITNYKFNGTLDNNYPESAGIYIITNIDTEKVLYVGQTSNLRRRFAEHLDSGKFKNIKVIFEYFEMKGASYNNLNTKEKEMIDLLKPEFNIQAGGGNYNRRSFINYTDWNGRGIIKKIKNVSELRNYIVGITGTFDGYEREEIISALQSKGIDIKPKRISKSANLWIVGKDGTVGSVKNGMIDETDNIMTHDNLVYIMNSLS